MDATNGALKPIEMDGLSNGMINGISNGSPHKKHKHKDVDRERDRHKSSHKDKDRERDRSKDHHSSHKSSHREKDRDKDRHRDRHKDSHDKDRHRSKEDRHRSKDDKHSDRSKDKDRHRDKDKRSSGSGEKREKDRHHHSSHKSSRKDRHRESSSSTAMKVERSNEESYLNDSKSSDDFKPIKQELFKPIKQEEFKPIKEEEFKPVKHDEFKPVKLERTILKEEMLESEEEEQKLVIKEEPSIFQDDNEDEDDIPLASRKRIKIDEESDEDDIPLISRKKIKVEKRVIDDDFQPKKPKTKRKLSKEVGVSPVKKKKKVEEENVWKWWEEEKKDDGVKWKFLEHKGPVFAPSYERIPDDVKFYYKGKHMKLSENAEEVAGFYARMIDHEYTTKAIFNNNFFTDWRKMMTSEERSKIVDLKECDFKKLNVYYLAKNEERKNRTKEEKKELKLENENIVAEYGWCMIDKHKQKIGNFKIEPPGLFRGRGEHPKMGKLKRRFIPEDIIINCSKDSKYPQPPKGHKWKEVRNDPTVTWLACWIENVQNQTKYVMLNAASKLKGEKDWQKYEMARKLHKIVDGIRANYRANFKSKEMRVRQRAVALYFIDKLALRAGNEKDDDQADTVGCCSLRVEHVKLMEENNGREYVVALDFLGKDSIRYYNEVEVEKRVFKNLQLFVENKQDGDDLFDRLNTAIMNKHLNELMDGLTAKVFRTYNASRTLQEQLEKLTDEDDNIPQLILSYNRANREVAILCNHQRAVPKTFEKSMGNLQQKIIDKRSQLHDEERHLRDLKKEAKHGGSVKNKMLYEKKKKAVERVKDQLDKLEISATDKEENKQIALGTSKLNYLDPRISVAWAKKYNVPIEKIYNKTQRQKFQWAIDMATADYNFMGEPMNMTRNPQDDSEEEAEDDE